MSLATPGHRPLRKIPPHNMNNIKDILISLALACIIVWLAVEGYTVYAAIAGTLLVVAGVIYLIAFIMGRNKK